jgi:formylglycine-generating enzyme required for sulfatase activity
VEVDAVVDASDDAQDGAAEDALADAREDVADAQSDRDDAPDATDLDAGTDAAIDATRDTTSDASAGDAASDVTADAASDATVDTSSDASASDAAADVVADHAEDADAALVCGAGTANCDGLTGNGCEISTVSDPTNCGACGTVCANAHGTTTCAGGACAPLCAAGFADCNGVKKDGCETSTTTDANHCGACGRACTGASTCQAGECVSPSCASGGADGHTNCGTSSNESCCLSPTVTGGSVALDGTHAATVSSFRLDKYEITVGRFRAFVAAVAAGWAPASGAGKHAHLNGGQGLSDGAGGFEPGWDTTWTPTFSTATSGDWATRLGCNTTYHGTWTSSPQSRERYPIECATFYELYAFCIWDGGFLPSEAEWQYAAAGGSENRTYPWGSAVADDSHAIFCGGTCDGTRPVGSLPLGNGKFGQSDLAGNSWEWAVDAYVTAYALASYADSAVFTPLTYRARRGGSFDNGEPQMHASNRNYNKPTGRSYNGGARCARIP